MSKTPRLGTTATLYLLMLAAGVGLFFVVRHFGETMFVAHEATSQGGHAEAPPAEVLPKVLLALVAVVLVGRAIGGVLNSLGQPAVIGELVAGILLGPSFLGRIWPAASNFILPATAAPFLAVLAQIGVIFYMFLVGLELNTGRLRSQAHLIVAISHASIALPFLLGVLLALALFQRLAPPGVAFTSFALFMGAAMSITAFPVLARILTDRGQTRSDLGVLALACAAMDDVTAWCLLALVVAVAKADMSAAAVTVALSVLFTLFMLALVRPVVARIARTYQDQSLPPGAFVIVLVGVLLSALATETIGIHAVFGAFLLGAIIPHDSGLARCCVQKLDEVVTSLLLPAFFAYTGMRTEIGLMSGLDNWLICGLIILVATLGKFGGTLIASRLSGLNWRFAASLGVLMNTRGLMEIIVLNIGLDLKIISPTLFAMMVLMALVTTFATTPLLVLIERRGTQDTPDRRGHFEDQQSVAVPVEGK